MRNILVTVIGFLFLASSSVSAQEYYVINEDLKLYCIQFPDDSTVVAVYEKETKNIAISDFDTEIQRVAKHISKNRARIRTLNNIIESNTVPEGRGFQKFKAIYRYINDKKFRGDADQVIEKARGLKKKLNKEIERFQDDIDAINDCEKEILPPPLGLGAEVVKFQFYNPDYDSYDWMSGILIKARLSGRGLRFGYGTLCSSIDHPRFNGDGGRFPFEEQITVNRNACGVLIGTVIRGYTYCLPLGEDIAVNWVEWGTTVSEPSQSRMEELQRKLESMGNFHTRPYKKKKGGCFLQPKK